MILLKYAIFSIFLWTLFPSLHTYYMLCHNALSFYLSTPIFLFLIMSYSITPLILVHITKNVSVFLLDIFTFPLSSLSLVSINLSLFPIFQTSPHPFLPPLPHRFLQMSPILGSRYVKLCNIPYEEILYS